MPIPTDTFWNIPRLNKIFAVSAVLLLAVTGWAIWQDYDRQWRQPQQEGRVWEAALVEERIQRELTEEQRQQLAALEQQKAAMEARIEREDEEYIRLSRQLQQTEDDRSKLEFRYNTLIADVNVMEAQLQDAITAGDRDRIRRIQERMQEPRARTDEMSEELGRLTQEGEDLRQRLNAKTADLDELRRQHVLMVSDLEMLQNRLAALRPTGFRARFSQRLRAAPLMQFINPAERVHQIVLPDVLTDLGGFMRVETIDRCMTCHVNVNKRDFAEDRILAYLEEQVATSRRFVLPEQPGARAADPQATVHNPGPVAMVDFWHHWTSTLVPDALRRNAFRIRTLAGQVGQDSPIRVTYQGQPLESFEFDLDATDPEVIQRQNEVLVEVIQAWYRFQRPADPAVTVAAVSEGPRVRVEIMADVPDRTASAARTAALKYPEILLEALEDQLSQDLYRQLIDRYRYGMTSVVNARRREVGLDELDASPVMLAHPNLDLYVDIDSPHSFEAVGCTSCHDGSGQETSFILAAHTPRAIWVDERTGEPVLPHQLDLRDRPAQTIIPDLTSMLAAAYGAHREAETAVEALHLALEPQEVPAADLVYPAPDASGPIAYVDPVTGGAGRAVPQLQHWRRKYEAEAGLSYNDMLHHWDTPMRPMQYLEASCVRCHTSIHDVAEDAPTLYAGRTLFAQLGCLSCHAIDHIPEQQIHMVGTDLRNITAKLSPEFIHTWIWAPKAFRPTTQMPHFFMLENNSTDEELRRTRQEARAITEYLVQNASPWQPQYQLPQGLSGNVQNGRNLFNTIGCVGCHTNLNEVGEEWITTDLATRAGLSPGEAASRFEGMSYNERHLYVLHNFPEPPPGRPLPSYADGSPRPVFINHGPELSGIGTKLTAARSEDQARAWLFDWLKNPSHYAEYTVMPSLRLDDQQAIDLAEYLLAQRRSTTTPDDVWSAGLPEVDSEKLREMTALFFRARFTPRRAYQEAANDAELTTLATEALVTEHRDREEAGRIAQAMSLEQKQMVFLGERLISHYGCMSCHAINGTEDMASPGANLSDWGEKRITMLDFAYLDGHKNLPPTTRIDMVNALSAQAANIGHTLPESGSQQAVARPVEVAWPVVEHSREHWLTHKLLNPRIYDRGKVMLDPAPRPPDAEPGLAHAGRPYDKLKMPSFYLTDEQVTALVTFVISNREPLISPGLLAQVNNELAQRIAFGRELADRYNCIGCHQIEQNTPPVQQYFPEHQALTHAPPPLRGQGAKTQHGWLFNFLRNVETIRPVPQIRMPTFPLSDQEITALAAYFNAASVAESHRLTRMLEQVLRYINEQRAAQPMQAEPLEPTAVWPGDDWWNQPAFAPAAQYLRQWAIGNTPMTEIQFDPTVYSPDELGRNYREALFRAQFIMGLFDAPYPFVDQPRAQISEERFALGERFFHEMACLQCHVMGDPQAPGAHGDPTAPNLSLVHDRLQRRFVRHWVQEPPTIQPGTAMPPFFSGMDQLKVDGLPYHVAQQVPNPDEIAEQYGQTVQEQTELLLDFLYAAGRRGHTSVQPGGIEEQPDAQPAEQAPDEPAEEQQQQAQPEGEAEDGPATGSPPQG
jgi:cytochrome c551/c552